MNKRSLSLAVCVVAVFLSARIVRGQSYSYSNAVEALSPAAYWPLDETNQSVSYIATNSGTLGAQANGFYGTDFYPSGSTYNQMNLFGSPVAGPTSDGATAANFTGGAHANDDAAYVYIPENPALNNGPVPFTAECWVMPGGGDPNDPTGVSFASSEFTSLMKKGGGISFYTAQGDVNGNTYGWAVSLTGIYGMGPPGGWYGGFSPGEFLATNAAWVVDFFNGANGNVPSLEFDVPMAEPTPQWFHLVLTYDGTNANFYTNGSLAATTVLGLPQSTNHIIAPNQLGITSSTGANQFSLNGQGQGYVPDPVNGLVIGNNNESADIINGGWPATNNNTGFNTQTYNGGMADLAVYTNALSAGTVLQHYTDATAVNTTLYTNDVLSAHPPIFLRFNEPAYTVPSPSTFTVANSYGTASGLNGAYQPGVVPGEPGAVAGGLGPVSRSAAINGMYSAVDVGGGVLFGSDLDPQNGVNTAFSVAYFFKANPADCYARFQTILGRGDQGWRSSLDRGGSLRWNPGSGPEIASPANYNDGVWHFVVGVSDGTTASLYVDGQLVVSHSGVGTLAGVSDDLLIGGAPDYTTKPNAGGQTARFFSGSIAQVAFFTNALAASDVSNLYNAAVVAPQITQQPASSTTIGLGAFGSLSVGNLGSSLNYQWYQGTTPLVDTAGNISGSTTATLTITNAALTNGGNYTVVITNIVGAVTSSVANVIISQAPTFLIQPPANNRLYVSNQITFTVGAVGAATITYQWYNGGSLIGGATATNYTATAVLGSSAFTCVAQNTFGFATSSVATVVGQAPPPNLTVNYEVEPGNVGQGAYNDPGNNVWNTIFEGVGSSAVATNSSGARTLVTETVIAGLINGQVGNAFLVTNGQPSYVVCYEDAVNAGHPGIGTSGAPEGQLTINNLPQGTYELYLYGANYDGDRGTAFALAPANGGTADGGISSTVNGSVNGTGAIAAGKCKFAEGDNYVLFTNVVADATGAITVTYVPNLNSISGNNGEAPFNGFQVIEVVPPTMTLQRLGGTNAVIMWNPTIGTLESSTNVNGPYTSVPGVVAPYTNSLTTGTSNQLFFRVQIK